MRAGKMPGPDRPKPPNPLVSDEPPLSRRGHFLKLAPPPIGLATNSKEAFMTDRRAPTLGFLVFATVIWSTAPTSAADRSVEPAARQAVRPAAHAALETTEGPQQPSEGPSDAERIARLDRSLQADEKRLSELKATLDEPDSESAEAQAAFEKLDAELIKLRKQRDQLDKYASPKEEHRLRDEIAALEKKWSLARDRFDLAIREHKAVGESINALEEKIKHDRRALENLRGEAASDSASGPGNLPAAPQADPAKSSAAPGNSPQLAPHSPPADPAAGSNPGKGSAGAAHPSQPHMAELKQDSTGGEEAELAEATATAQKAEAEADEAEEESHSLTERIEILKKNIALARQLGETAHKKVDNADEGLKNLNEELFRKLLEGANTDGLKQQITEASERVREARSEQREASRQLDELQSSLTALQAEQLTAAGEAEQKRQTAEAAAEVVKELNNPFTLHNLLQWLLDHGPKVIAILIAVAVSLRVSRIVEGRLVSFIANRGRIGNRQERENRAKTLLGIFHNAANILILGGGTVVLLDEVGIPVAPLIGGAAVIGLAAAFGAQSLIKDYFTGFLVLLEQQYLVNDIVKIGQISGQVERITLRTTALRDTEGHLHFIPHGQITTVTNTTHGWARAVFEIRVSYRENVDHVINVLQELAAELAASEHFRGMILEEPVTPGVDSFTDSGVLVKFNIKTRPLQARPVRREMLRRIKNKFDELGIEIPYPQLMLNRRGDVKLGVLDPRERKAG
jgi:moderate conductance mechanosensitive channel